MKRRSEYSQDELQRETEAAALIDRLLVCLPVRYSSGWVVLESVARDLAKRRFMDAELGIGNDPLDSDDLLSVEEVDGDSDLEDLAHIIVASTVVPA